MNVLHCVLCCSRSVCIPPIVIGSILAHFPTFLMLSYFSFSYELNDYARFHLIKGALPYCSIAIRLNTCCKKIFFMFSFFSMYTCISYGVHIFSSALFICYIILACTLSSILYHHMFPDYAVPFVLIPRAFSMRGTPRVFVTLWFIMLALFTVMHVVRVLH